jgi:hypothetical protein
MEERRTRGMKYVGAMGGMGRGGRRDNQTPDSWLWLTANYRDRRVQAALKSSVSRPLAEDVTTLAGGLNLVLID